MGSLHQCDSCGERIDGPTIRAYGETDDFGWSVVLHFECVANLDRDPVIQAALDAAKASAQ